MTTAGNFRCAFFLETSVSFKLFASVHSFAAMSGDMAGLGRVDKLRVEGGLTVTTASVEAGEVLLHVPPLVTGPGRGGSAVQLELFM